MSRKWIGAAVVLAAAVIVALAPSRSAAASTKCPSGGTPPPGSVIKGGLEVDGFQCNLTGVTVYGGITIDGTDSTGSGELPFGYLSYRENERRSAMPAAAAAQTANVVPAERAAFVHEGAHEGSASAPGQPIVETPAEPQRPIRLN